MWRLYCEGVPAKGSAHCLERHCHSSFELESVSAKVKLRADKPGQLDCFWQLPNLKQVLDAWHLRQLMKRLVLNMILGEKNLLEITEKV